jgi:hypothetical protein
VDYCARPYGLEADLKTRARPGSQRCDALASAVALEPLTAEDDAEAVPSEPEFAAGLVAADRSAAGLGDAAGAPGADVAGVVPLGEVEQHDFPWAGVVEQQGAFGAETPAMPDPRPSFCRLEASSFPLGSRPLAD